MSHDSEPRAAGPSPTIRALLDPEDPLARVELRVRTLHRQVGAVAIVLLAAAAGALAGRSEAVAVALAAAVVLGFLLLALWSALSARRERAVGLIAEGRATLPLAPVQRELARLTDPGLASALARSLESLRREADVTSRARWHSVPLYVPSVIRAADDEIVKMIGTLRDSRPGPVVVARVERLLCGPASPLYGGDARALREELHRIRFTAGLRRAGRFG